MSQTRRVISQLDEFTEDLISRLTLEITGELIEATPVDTGWARANWVPQIGSSFEETAGTKEEAELGQIDQGQQQQGISEVTSSYRLPRLVYVTNNVPYINRLNEGSSEQAPAGFVQNSIEVGIREVT